jgi:hypothetical protein
LTSSSSWLWFTQGCLERNSNFWERMAKRWALEGRRSVREMGEKQGVKVHKSNNIYFYSYRNTPRA